MTTLLSDWLSGPDSEILPQSLRRFIGADAYDLPELHTELARFIFLVGHYNGDQP